MTKPRDMASRKNALLDMLYRVEHETDGVVMGLWRIVLKRMYVEWGLSTSKIEKLTGVKTTAITYDLESFGVPRRPQGGNAFAKPKRNNVKIYTHTCIDCGDTWKSGRPPETSRKQCKPGGCQRKRKEILTITYKDQTLTIMQWSLASQLHQETIRKRLGLGWTAEQILTTNPDKANRINLPASPGRNLCSI